uniref:Uncharacterized protein n=1 Tax=Meloidogyne hapla TaxID=6305 RepID=A0A1I8BDE2_MELHA
MTISATSILSVCCKKSKKSSKSNKLANVNNEKETSASKINKKKKKSEKTDKPKIETNNEKQKQTFSEIKKLKTTSKKTTVTCMPDKTTLQKKDIKEEANSNEKERKNSDLKTAKSIKLSKSELSIPSESMMSKHEIVDVNFIVSSKNIKPPKGQASFSVFNQIRKNAAHHLMEDMSSLHAYDQAPLIDKMRMPKRGKDPILKETDNTIYVCDEAETKTVAASTSTEPDLPIRESGPVRRWNIGERNRRKKY